MNKNIKFLIKIVFATLFAIFVTYNSYSFINSFIEPLFLYFGIFGVYFEMAIIFIISYLISKKFLNFLIK